MKKGYFGNIEDLTNQNTDFRKVLYTGAHMQLVLMTLEPAEEIGMEAHEENDQFFRFESGLGTVIVLRLVMLLRPLMRCLRAVPAPTIERRVLARDDLLMHRVDGYEDADTRQRHRLSLDAMPCARRATFDGVG
jgi:hypothetical protein